MYSHCIFCKGHLGNNIVVENLPVGRRVAFDSGGGRLWVICPFCHRWNLSPLEERWEIIEECERLFSRSHRRVSTDHIGLSMHPAGLSLVRIGAPGRPEMAAWRYGDKLLDRRRRHTRSKVWTGMAVLIGWPALLPTIAYRSFKAWRPLVETEGVTGSSVRLAGRDAKHMRLVPASGAWSLTVGRIDRPRVVATDDEAVWIAGQLLPWVNRAGSSTDGVERAVRQIERAGSPEELFHNAASRLQERGSALLSVDGLVRRAPEELRLALEMASHEDLELQAARGELAQLEKAWREAEKIAQIADNLLIPEPVRRMLHQLRGRMPFEGGDPRRS
jgi:hypothetical protein